MKTRHGKLKVNGLRLHYLEWGPEGGPVWLLLHGFTGNARQWQPLAEVFGDRYRIIALDQRGHGLSDWAPDGAYNVWDFVADIVAVVERLGLDKFLLAGHSMGGRHALLYAVCHPDQVARLVVMDARPGPDEASSRALGSIVAALPSDLPSRREAARVLRHQFPRLSPSMAHHAARYHWKRRAPGGLTFRHDLSLQEAALRSGFPLEDLRPLLGHITCPTLVVRGEESEVLSGEEALLLARAIPGSRLVEIRGAGHLVPWEQPEAFYQALRDFLGGDNP